MPRFLLVLLLTAPVSAQLFGPTVDLGAAISAWSIQGADVNHDGHMDLVIADSSDLIVLPGDSTGSFGAELRSDLTGQFDMAIADVDGDGFLDVLLGGSPLFPQMYYGDGTGLFAEVNLPVGKSRGPSIGDLTGDGLPDLVGTSNGISLYAGNGTRSYGFPSFVDPVLLSATRVRIVDVDRDGRKDLVQNGTTVVLFGSLDVSMIRNAGGGAFDPAIVSLGPVGFTTVQRLEVGDFTGDGEIDVFQWGFTATDAIAYLFVGQGDGTFPEHRAVPLGQTPFGLQIGDVDGDGDLDAAVGAIGDEFIRVLLNDGAGFFTANDIPTAGVPRQFALLDVDGDGNLDLVTSHGDQRMLLRLGSTPPPVGTTSFGDGTPGCRGRIGLRANGPASVGNAAFGLTCTNAPEDSLGALLIGLPAATPIPIVGLTLHLQPFPLLAANIFRTDLGGTGWAPLPIPPDNGLSGAPFAVQGLWASWLADGQTCSAAPSGFVASRGLSIVIQ